MQLVKRSNPGGVDYGRAIQMTFVTTILVGSPIVAIPSVNAGLQTWGMYARPAIRVGAAIWFATVAALFIYAKRINVGDSGTPPEAELGTNINAED